MLFDISECSAISKEGSSCTISGLGNQYVPATMLGMEMNSRFPPRTGDRSRTCLLDQTRYVWNDETGVPSRTNETPLHLNEMFESLVQTRETNGTSSADVLRQNLRSFRESGLRAKPGIQSHMPLKIYPRMRSRKHSRVRQKQRSSHQMSYLVSTLSNKVGVFSSDESSPKRILPCLSDKELVCSCSGGSVYSCHKGPPYSCSRRPVYSCGAGPLYSLSGQSDADVSNLSADDDISRFCQNYSPDGGTSNCSMVGSDFILGDASSFDSQTTDWSLRTKVTAAPHLSPLGHSLPLSSLPNTHLDNCNAVSAASRMEQCQNLTTSNNVSTDKKHAENLSCEPFLETLPSVETRLCKIRYCTNRSTLVPLPHIDLLCNSPGLHKRSSRLSKQCPKLNGIATDTVYKQVSCTGVVASETDCFSCQTHPHPDFCPEHSCTSMEVTCPNAVCSQSGIEQNYYRFCDVSSWDKSSDCSLQLSLLSLSDSQASFST